MAGHSQFKNIMHRKGAQDAKRAKAFTKIIREITVAVKTGAVDAAYNPRLRSALIAAREANMPKDNIDRAIKKATSGEDSADYTEVRYEGYGPGSVAIIVEALTDNRNRTASEIRSAFSKHGGSLGEMNSVSFMFEHAGLILYPATLSGDAVFEGALEAGASNVDSSPEGHQIECAVEDFTVVRDALIEKFGEPLSAKLAWLPKTTAPLSEDQAPTLFKLIDILEDNDDVQRVFANFEISDELAEKLANG